MAIYTVGYSRITPADLVKLVADLQIDTVVDARSVPVTRRSGFGRRQLETLLGAKYQWRGEDLGGRPPGATTDGLAELRAANTNGLRRLIMCMEHAPADCHRHHTIGLPLAREGVEVFHIFEDEVLEARELQRSIADDDEYSCSTVAEHVSEIARFAGTPSEPPQPSTHSPASPESRVKATQRPSPGKHSRLKGSGMGYLSTMPAVSFRLTTTQRDRFIEEAEARGTTLADLARTLVLDALDCPTCNVRPPKATR
jgi:hypothetical protein